MKKFKVTILITLLIALVVFVALYKGWQRKAYTDVVHADATTVIKIDVNELIKTLAWDFVGNWEHYTSKDKDSIQNKEKEERGINIPASVFLYTVPQASNTVFCTLKTTDSVKAISFLSNKLGISQEISGNKFYQKSNKKHTISLAQREETLILAFSYKKEDLSKVFEDILIDKKYMTPDHPVLQRLKKENHHVTITGEKEMMLHLDSKDGMITFLGTLKKPEDLEIEKSSQVPLFSEEACIQMYVSGRLKDKSFLQSKIGDTIHWAGISVSTERLFRNYQDRVVCMIKESTIQKDSVVTYEYNDDFEKIPVVSIQEKEVPNLLMSFHVDSIGTVSYLKNVGVVDNNGLIKDAPLYQLYTKEKRGELMLSTSKDFSVSFQNTKPSKDFFRVQVQIDKLIQENHFPILSPFISSMNYIDVKAKKAKEETINIEGMITFKEGSVNAITQLLK